MALEEAKKELPQEAKEEEEMNKKEQEVAAKLEEIEATMKRTKHRRPWDRGKSKLPNFKNASILFPPLYVTVVDPIKKQKMELEDERLPEFAPPASYYKNEKSAPVKQNPTASCATMHLVNTELSDTMNTSSYHLPPLFSHPTSSTSNNSFTKVTTGKNTTECNNDVIEEINDGDLAVQKPDDIRESVTEVLRYYKSKYAVHE